MKEQQNQGVLVVDDEQSLRITLGAALTDAGYSVYEAAHGDEAFSRLREHQVSVVMLDLRLQASGENGIDILKKIKRDYPEVEVIMMTAYGEFGDVVEATRAGSFQFIAKPFEIEQLKLVVHAALQQASLRQEVEVLKHNQAARFPTDRIIGESPLLKDLLAKVEMVARGKATILLQGETGAGKEVIAGAIHRSSKVASGPLVELNCSAVPENLLESELFGHEKGAFTDAKSRKKGVFELADKGTLFLDEIGDMAHNLQAKLLRVLETNTFKRVGGTADIQVKVRVVAATHRDLKEAIAEGRFREDLFFRLNVVNLVIPPLRERLEDILPLSEFFLDHFNREIGTHIEGFTDRAKHKMLHHAWPGNVRELRNVIERAVLLTSGSLIDAEAIPDTRATSTDMAAMVDQGPDVMLLTDMERLTIAKALKHFDGNKTKTAEGLGIARATLRAKIKDYGLDD